VEKATPVKLYYISYGRNAWNSTWIQRYTQGCMHLSFASASAYAESRRTQGTVFYVRELPALCFTGDGPALFVTEINSKHPLAEFLPEKADLQGRFEDVADFFSPRKPNSALRLFSNDSSQYESFLGKSTPLPRYQSFPNGNSEPLGWKQKDSETRFDAVFALAKAFNGDTKSIELPVKLGEKKKEVSRTLGPPRRISRHALKDLSQEDQKHLENRNLSDSDGIEKWYFQVGMEKVVLYFMTDRAWFGTGDPGLLAFGLLEPS
jgi:hypothetical protein